MIGDQQAALFGYDCRRPGDAECTHGTASFVNVCLGDTAPEQERLNVYYAWHLGVPTFCLEADTTVTGAALRWMAQTARLLDSEDQVGPLAATEPDSGGVTFVPAFTGLNVPYDRPQARGALLGLTLGTTRGHIARAFLEAIGFQIRHILDTIRQDVGVTVERLSVGGGHRSQRPGLPGAGRPDGHPGGAAGFHADHRPGGGAAGRPGRRRVGQSEPTCRHCRAKCKCLSRRWGQRTGGGLRPLAASHWLEIGRK